MGTVRVGIRMDPGAARNAVKRAVGPVVRRRVEQAGKEMVRTANALMADQFNLNRPNERRRYPGSRRAATALDYSITGNADDRLELRFRVLGGEQVFKRILGMNYGMGGGHDISPSGNWDLKGARLAVRNEPTGAGSGAGQLAWQDDGGNWVNVRGSVFWQPSGAASQGTGFLEEAARRAAASLGGTL